MINPRPMNSKVASWSVSDESEIKSDCPRHTIEEAITSRI
jgi:hypothetical protein